MRKEGSQNTQQIYNAESLSIRSEKKSNGYQARGRRVRDRRVTERGGPSLRTVWRRPLDRTPSTGSGGQDKSVREKEPLGHHMSREKRGEEGRRASAVNNGVSERGFSLRFWSLWLPVSVPGYRYQSCSIVILHISYITCYILPKTTLPSPILTLFCT
jgi:hypothetical protein